MDARSPNLADAVRAIEQRHLHVHEDDVGLQSIALADRRLGGFCLADDLDVAVGSQHLGETRAEPFAFVEHKHADG